MTEIRVEIGRISATHNHDCADIEQWFRSFYSDHTDWLTENARGRWWLDIQGADEVKYESQSDIYYLECRASVVFDEITDAVHYKLRWS